MNAALDPDPAVPGVAVVVAAGAPAPAAENVKECIRKEEKKMPGGDRTGPMGMGPMTGRGAGFCGGYAAPGFANPGWGFGRGMGRGFGRGRGWWRWGGPARGAYFGAPGYAPGNPWGAWEITREEELDYLKGQASALKDELDAITQRVGELESEGGED